MSGTEERKIPLIGVHLHTEIKQSQSELFWRSQMIANETTNNAPLCSRSVAMADKNMIAVNELCLV